MRFKGNTKLYWKFTLFGGAAFWLPDIFVHWLPLPSGAQAVVLLLFIPIVFFVSSAFYLRRPACQKHSIGFPAFTLAGIWFFGPPAMWLGMLSERSSGDHGEIMEQLFFLLMTWLAFPITTFIMSAYSGSMGALLFVTPILCIIILIACINRFRKRNRPQTQA